MKKKQKQKSLNSRLWPLYIGYFLQWSVFWFATEKLFMSQIGFNAQWVGIYVAILATAALISEFPSSILADKWSLKSTMVLSSVTLALTCFIGYISSDITSYMVLAILWGVFLSLQTGTLEAIVYDSLIETNGNSDRYEHEYSKLDIICSVALVIGAVCGGIIGEKIGIRDTYLFSIPAAILSLVFMLSFKQPKKKKQKKSTSTIEYFNSILEIIRQDKKLLMTTIVLVIISLTSASVGEMRQLLIGALSMPVIFYGIASVVSYSATGIGSYFSRYLKSSKNLSYSLVIALIALATLIITRNAVVNTIAQFAITVSLYGASIVLTHQLLNKMPAELRAGAASAVGIIRQMGIIPVTILYGYVATKTDVFNASWIFFALICIALTLRITNKTYSILSRAYVKISK